MTHSLQPARSGMRVSILLFLLPKLVRLLTLAACLSSIAEGATVRRIPELTTLMYLVNRSDSINSFELHAPEISVIAPQVFTMDEQGFVEGEVPSPVLDIARRHHVAVMPLVTNRHFNQPLMHTVLDSPVARARAIRYLLYYALRDGYIGFQFDYENIHYTYRDKFTTFFQEAARCFHRHGLLLSAAVVGKYSDEPDAPAPGGYENWSGVYDYRALGRSADFLSVMAYPQHAGFSDPGPLAGVPWVRQIADFSTGKLARRKVSLGIPLYGVEWDAVIPPLPTSVNQTQTSASASAKKWNVHSTAYSDILARLPAESPSWDTDNQAHHFVLNRNGSLTEIWYEDADSLRPKLELASRERFIGVSGWVLGREDPRLWSLLAREYRVRHPRCRLITGSFDRRARAAARRLEGSSYTLARRSKSRLS